MWVNIGAHAGKGRLWRLMLELEGGTAGPGMPPSPGTPRQRGGTAPAVHTGVDTPGYNPPGMEETPDHTEVREGQPVRLAHTRRTRSSPLGGAPTAGQGPATGPSAVRAAMAGRQKQVFGAQSRQEGSRCVFSGSHTETHTDNLSHLRDRQTLKSRNVPGKPGTEQRRLARRVHAAGRSPGARRQYALQLSPPFQHCDREGALPQEAAPRCLNICYWNHPSTNVHGGCVKEGTGKHESKPT